MLELMENRELFLVNKGYATIAALFSCCVIWVSAGKGFADRVVLKDGTVITSDRIWESEKYIHFILKGTAEVEIRYIKEIVDRIESGDPPNVLVKYKNKTGENSVKTADQQINNDILNELDPTAANSENPEGKAPSIETSQQAKLNAGILFYDPRRKKRYWAGRNAQFNTLDDAINELSQEYQRTPEWVEKYIGEMNDLGVIHDNLNQQLAVEMTKNGNATFSNDTPAFQQPDHKSHPSTAFQNRKDGTGQPNDDDSIKDNGSSLAVENGDQKKSATPKIIKNPVMDTDFAQFEGLVFYDPRRPEKYWVTPTDRHATLNSAIEALAKYHGVTVDWVETHMGDTNNLKQLHVNLANSLHQ